MLVENKRVIAVLDQVIVRVHRRIESGLIETTHELTPGSVDGDLPRVE